MTLLDELATILMAAAPRLSIWEAQNLAEQYILEVCWTSFLNASEQNNV